MAYKSEQIDNSLKNPRSSKREGFAKKARNKKIRATKKSGELPEEKKYKGSTV